MPNGESKWAKRARLQREEAEKLMLMAEAMGRLFAALDVAGRWPIGDPLASAARILKASRVTFSVTGRYWSKDHKANAVEAQRQRRKVVVA